MQQRRRATTACARCHNRKRKCDKKLPKCSACRDAGVECKGLSHDANVDAPRSVVQYLEHSIAQLEAELAAAGGGWWPSPAWETDSQTRGEGSQSGKDHSSLPFRGTTQSFSSPAAGTGSTGTNFVANAARVSGFGEVTAIIDGFEGVPYKDALFMDSELPLPLSEMQGNMPQPLAQVPFDENAIPEIPESLPLDVVRTLSEIYLEKILPENPFFLEDDLRNHFDAVYGDQMTPPAEESLFITLMVLAVSTMTSKAYDQSKILSLSEGLHKQALEHSSFMAIPSLRTLQGFLLLLQLAELLPYTGNLWNLSGEAVSVCTELGLHQESPQSDGLDFRSRDLRRRLFWTTYCMERSTAVTSYRAFSLKDEHINVAFPTEYEDSFIKPGGIVAGGRRTKYQFLNYIRFRQIQSEILAVQFFGRPLPSETYKEWMSSMEGKLVNWRRLCISLEAEKAPDWFHHAVWQCYLMLHRPCPRNASPSEESIIACFEAARGVSSGSWELLQNGYLLYPFHNAHNGFEAATVVLYGLRHHTHKIREKYGSKQVVELIHQLSGLFLTLSQRWPAVATIRNFYDGLKKTTLNEFLAITNWAPSPYNFQIFDPLDLIVLHKPVATKHNPRITEIDATESLENDALDLTLSTFLDQERPIDSQGISEITPSEKFTRVESTSPQTDMMNDGSVYESPEAHISPDGGNWVPMPQIKVDPESLQNMSKFLPTCTRCRRRRIKCKRAGLQCEQCANTGSSCEYFDQLLSKIIPISYVEGLQKKLLQLVKDRDTKRESSDSYIPTQLEKTTGAKGSGGIHIRSNIPSLSNPERRPSFGGPIIDFSTSHDNTIFFGLTSTISHLEIVRNGRVLPDAQNPTSLLSSLGLRSLSMSMLPMHPELPPLSTCLSLIDVFANSINVLYHVADTAHLKAICTNNFNPVMYAERLDLQTLQMIIAISLHILSKDDHSLSTASEAYFKVVHTTAPQMSVCVQRNNLEPLRIAMLVCLYLLLRPKSGNIWRTIGFASRLALGMINLPRSSTREEQEYQLLFKTLLCLDCDIAIAYGRPPQLPDYTNTLATFSPPLHPGTAPDTIAPYMHTLHAIKRTFYDAVITTYPDITTRQHNIHTAALSSREELGIWYQGWSTLFTPPTFTHNHHQHPSQPQSQLSIIDPYLKAWGDHEYHTMQILFQRSCPSLTPSASERLLAIQQFLHCYKSIYSPSQSSARYIYPISYVTSHSILAAALDLVVLKEQLIGGLHDTVFQTCVGVLRVLEGDCDVLINGMGDVVEGLGGGVGA